MSIKNIVAKLDELTLECKKDPVIGQDSRIMENLEVVRFLINREDVDDAPEFDEKELSLINSGQKHSALIKYADRTEIPFFTAKKVFDHYLSAKKASDQTA